MSVAQDDKSVERDRALIDALYENWDRDQSPCRAYDALLAHMAALRDEAEKILADGAALYGRMYRKSANLLQRALKAEADLVVEREITANLTWAIEQATARPFEAWQAINTAPKDGTLILVARDMGEPWGWVRGTGRWDGARGLYGWICRGICDPPGELGLGAPTHWKAIGMPSGQPQ